MNLSATRGAYFLGSIVLVKQNRIAQSYVIDGQQRLITLTILLAALHKAIPDIADDITGFLYKKGKRSLDEKNEYRLIARDEDAKFFRTNVQEPNSIAQFVISSNVLKDSQLRLRENAILLLDRVKQLSADDRKKLWQFLASNCSLVIISTTDVDAAYRIFSVLSNRGLDLAPVDILKAEILGAIRQQDDEEQSLAYAKEWSHIEKMLDRGDFGHLFSHLRALKNQNRFT